jgi:hypothetical protein
VSCNEQFNTHTANMQCFVQQRLVDFTGVNEDQGSWQLQVMWELNTSKLYYVYRTLNSTGSVLQFVFRVASYVGIKVSG